MNPYTRPNVGVQIVLVHGPHEINMPHLSMLYTNRPNPPMMHTNQPNNGLSRPNALPMPIGPVSNHVQFDLSFGLELNVSPSGGAPIP